MSPYERFGLPNSQMLSPRRKADVSHVTTMLTVDERLRVDAAGLGAIYSLHRESLHDVWQDLRQYRAKTLIVSTAMCQRTNISQMARMVREFPRVPAVALLSQFDPGTARTVLALGQCGVRTLIDVREPAGWRELRAVLLNDRASDVLRLAMSRVAVDLVRSPEGARRFFEVLFSAAPKTSTIRQLAEALQILPGTLMSRFFRAHLPPPKRYLAYARLTCAARLFENPGLSISSISNQLDYSSPQSFSRHVRALLDMSAVEFRSRYDGEGMLECLRENLILRFREQWQLFDPLGRSPAEIAAIRQNRSGPMGLEEVEGGA